MNKIKTIVRKKGKIKIVALTAYDYPTARILDESGVDMVLVGDSLAMVMRGEENTKKVTMDEMIYHAKMVRRAVSGALVVGDMPINTYRTPAEALKNARRFVHEGGVDAVKLEGGEAVQKQIRNLVQKKIPVLGHVGMTPQKAKSFKVKGRSPQGAARVLRDAAAAESAGVFALVLECIPSELARQITDSARCPTIGIGAGKNTDGQILVTQDILGIRSSVQPRFVRRYENLEKRIRGAAEAFLSDVRRGNFPASKESFQ